MRDIPTVLWGGLRLLGRHWPALLTLAFVGGGLRAADNWGAVHVSQHHHVLGQLMLILAPICYLLAVAAMFAVCRTSLPRLVELSRVRPGEMPSERRPERLIDVAASVLIPFLAVYEGYGLVEADLTSFRNSAGAADALSVYRVNLDRVGIYPVKVAVLIVLGAWIIRWLIGLAERSWGLLVLAYVGALADVFYTVQLAFQAVVLRNGGVQWLEERKALHWIVTGYDRVLSALGSVSGPFDSLVGFVQAVVASWDAIIVVPIAWLGVGAVILARQEADEEEAAESSSTNHARPTRWPAPVRLVLSLLADVRKRVSALVGALRLMASAGLLPMLAFSLVLLVTIRLPVLLSYLARDLVGPVPTDTWLAFSPILDSVQLSLSLALSVPLVAAAVEWLVTRRLERRGLVRDLNRRTGDRSESTDDPAPITPVEREVRQDAGNAT